MQNQVVYEYDPATGQIVASSLPDDLFSGVAAEAEAPARRLQLSAAGKARLQKCVAEATSLELLGDIDAAIDAGHISDQLAVQLGLGTNDFVVPSSAGATSFAAPRKLSAAGRHSLRQRALAATSLEALADIEEAVEAGHAGAELAARLGLVEADFEEPLRRPPPPTQRVAVAKRPPPPVPNAAGLAKRRLSATGKEKLKRHVVEASSAEALDEIDGALGSGQIGHALATKLGLSASDFEQAPPHAPAVPPPGGQPAVTASAPVEQAHAPLGALGLTPSGLRKVRTAIQVATDLDLLKILDTALAVGDIKRLQELLELLPEDLQRQTVDGKEAAAPIEPVVPATTETKDVQQKSADAPKAGEEPPGKKRKKEKKKAKEEKEKPKLLSWPLEWAWLIRRTGGHADFRQPALAADSRWAQPLSAGMKPRATLVALSTSVIYVGSASFGYEPHHLARIAVVDDNGRVLLDTTVRPRSDVLDYRTHLTGLSKESFERAVDLETAQSRLLELLQPETLMVGYRISSQLEAMKLYHASIIDVSLLYGVETRKQHQYHPLRVLAEKVLGIVIDENRPHDALENAQLIMQLAQHETKKPAPTPAFPPKDGNPCELAVRHLPLEWRQDAVRRVANLVPGSKMDFLVHWLLSEADPTDWRGETTLEFHTSIARDAAFDKLAALTEVHVQWEDLPGAPPLGTFMTEQSLTKAFSSFGIVVSARIPRKPTTREPQSFAFISFLDRADAERVAKQQSIEVELGPTWRVPLRPRLAKFGQSTDKRIAVRAGSQAGEEAEFMPLDWVHVVRR